MPNENQPSAQPQILLGWNATSMLQHERSPRWYLIGGLVVLAVILYGIFFGAWSFAVVMALCGGMYFLLRNHVPVEHTMALTEKGIFFDGAFTSYEDLRCFWIIETHQFNKLHVSFKRTRTPDLIIHTADVAPNLVRSVLGQYVEELKNKRESLIDIFIRICKL